MHRSSALVALVLLLAAGACSSSGKEAVVVKPRATATRSATTAVPHATTAQLTAKLLTPGELPAGWRVDPSASSSSSDGMPECLLQIDDSNQRTHAEADFKGGTDFPTFDEELESYEPATIASDLTSAMRILDGCKEFHTDLDGTPASGSITRASSFPRVGDQSVAYEMRMQARGFTFSFALVLVRKGDVAATLVYGDQSYDAVESAPAFIQAAVAKL